MAKCVRVIGQGVPVRMTDDEAFQVVVRDGDGEFCSKSFWRGWGGPKNPDGFTSPAATSKALVVLQKQLQRKRIK